MKTIYTDEHGPVVSMDDFDILQRSYDILQQEVESKRHELFHLNAHMQELYQWIKSDSVYTLLRYGSKSPSSSGMDDCEDNFYFDLYNLSTDLRKADREENETRKDTFNQQLP